MSFRRLLALTARPSIALLAMTVLGAVPVAAQMQQQSPQEMQQQSPQGQAMQPQPSIQQLVYEDLTRTGMPDAEARRWAQRLSADLQRVQAEGPQSFDSIRQSYVDALRGGQLSEEQAQRQADQLIAVLRQQQGRMQMAQQQGQEAQQYTVTSSGELAQGIVIERRAPRQVRVGEPFEVELVVRNTTDHPFANVVIHQRGSFAQAQAQQQQGQQQQTPQQREQQTGQQGQQGQQQQQDERTWNIGFLGPRESRTVTVRDVARSEGQVSSCFTVSYEPSVCASIAAVKPELELERVVVNEAGQPVDEVLVCDPVFVRYTVRNAGSGMTQPVRLQESLPEWLRTAEGDPRVSLDLGTLAAGEQVQRQVPLQAQRTDRYAGEATATTGPLTVQASGPPVAFVRPDLEVALEGPSEQYLDRPITYEVTVRNTGDAVAADPIIRVPLPEGAQRVSLSRSGIQRTEQGLRIGALQPGEERSFSLTFQATEPTQISTQATAAAYCAAGVESRPIQTAVVGVPAVLIEVVDQQDPVTVDGTTVYEIQVKNQGSAEDLNLQLQAQLPPGLQFVEGSGETQVQAQNGRLRFGTIDRLGPGEVATWNVTARATQPGQGRLEVRLQSDASRQPVIEMESTTRIAARGAGTGQAQQAAQPRDPDAMQQQRQTGEAALDRRRPQGPEGQEQRLQPSQQTDEGPEDGGSFEDQIFEE